MPHEYALQFRPDDARSTRRLDPTRPEGSDILLTTTCHPLDDNRALALLGLVLPNPVIGIN